MTDNEQNSGLAEAVHSAVKRQTRSALAQTGAVLGTMTGTGLKLDDFKHEIQDYLVAELPGKLKLPELKLSGTVQGLHDSTGDLIGGKGEFGFEPAEIEKASLDLDRGFAPGDRVLALRLNGGRDVLVMCKVVERHA